MRMVDVVSFVALAVGLAALMVTLRRQRALPELTAESRESMQTQIAELKRNVEALQRMLTEKQTEIDQLRERLARLEGGSKVQQTRQRETLALGLGTDPMLEIDLAALRGVRGVHLSVLRNVSMRSLTGLLERHRANGRAVRYLHLAAHARREGIEFADGLADGMWLSRTLGGVDVLVVGGCNSDAVGDLLSVVPHAVTMSDAVDNHDAAIFAKVFWSKIGEGATVDEAMDDALMRSPATVSEMVVAHWR